MNPDEVLDAASDIIFDLFNYDDLVALATLKGYSVDNAGRIAAAAMMANINIDWDSEFVP